MFALALLVVAPPALRVGAVFNVTGSFASTDGPGLHGVQLAVARSAGRVQVVTIDTRSDVNAAGAIVRQAIKRYRLDAIVGLYDSDYALVVGKEAQRARIPFVTSGATLPGLTRRIGNYAFTACYGDDDQARAMAAFAHHHLKAQVVTVAEDPRHVYTRTVAKDFGIAFEAKRGTSFSVKAERPQGVLPALHSRRRNDALYAAYLPEDAVELVRTARGAPFSGPILSGDGFDTADLWTTPGLDTSKVFFTTHVGYDAPDRPIRDFVRTYRARYGKTPESAAAALAFDSLSLVAEANARRGRGTLRDAIAATRDFRGVTGTIGYRRGSREPEKPVTVMEIVNGRPRRRALMPAG